MIRMKCLVIERSRDRVFERDESNSDVEEEFGGGG